MEWDSSEVKNNMVELKKIYKPPRIDVDGEHIYCYGDIFQIDDELYILVRIDNKKEGILCSLHDGNRWEDELTVKLFWSDVFMSFHTTGEYIDKYVGEKSKWEYVGKLDV